MVKRIDTIARKRRTQAGTSVVEATIVFPLMLLLVFGIGEFGVAFTQWNSLTNAVREGARTGVVFRSPCVANDVTALVKTAVEDYASSSGIDPVNITTTISPTCLPTGTEFTVTATLPFNYIALDALAGLAPSKNLTARSVMRNE